MGAADGGNTGAGAITAAPAVTAGAKQGAYKGIQKTGGATGAFDVFDPDGVFVGNGVVGTEFVGGGLTFTVTDPGADPAVGDSYTVTVTYTANAKFLGLAILTPAVPPVADGATLVDGYPQYFEGAFMTQGQMYVTAGASVVDGGDVYWLSRIISAESAGEPMLGKIAVGNVISNRVASPDYPDTIYDVIFDTKYGVQFEPTGNGTIYQTPTAESVTAARLCLDGASVVGGSLYFFNPATAGSSWIARSCTYYGTIGNHRFYT